MKLRGLELMRGMAALSVAAAHSDSSIGHLPALGLGHWHGWELPGSPGVEFFFVLSGFVMGLMHAAEIGPGGRPLAFLWRRACRIYPLFVLLLAVPIWRFWGAPIVTPAHILAWASLLPIRNDSLIVVAWTLRQEVIFYAVLALCLVPRIGPAVLLMWIGATAGWCLLGWEVPVPGLAGVVIGHLLNPFNFEFCAGLLAAVLLRRLPAIAAVGVGALGLGVVLVLWRMSVDDWGVNYGPASARLVYGAGYGSLLLGLAMLERAGALSFRGRWGRLARVAGAVSYPLYLCHLLVIDAVAQFLIDLQLTPRLGADAVFSVFLAASVIASLALAYAVDRPIQAALRGVGLRFSADSRSSPASWV